MAKENLNHIPNIMTTPEQILKEKGTKDVTPEKKLSSMDSMERFEKMEGGVYELAELSSARAEASKHLRETWGGLTQEERKDLVAKGEGAVVAHFEALGLDPELAEFQKQAVDEYDSRIQELASDPEILKSYKESFDKIKATLARAVSYEHLQKEMDAISSTEQKLQSLYEKIGRMPGPIESKKMAEIDRRKNEIANELKGFELDPQTIDMLRRREVKRIQRDIEKYSFAETESRTELIREILPDLIQGAPVLFQGETGSGKSQLAKYISEKYLGKSPVVISVSEQIKESQIMGSRGLEKGETVFNYSEFIKAQKEKRPIILDEINLMPHEFAGLLHELLQKRVGDTWTHPVTGEKISISAPIIATANLKSERYKQRYELDVATLRRFIGGAGAREINYLDLGKKDNKGNLIAPETLKILAAVLADKKGNILWDESEAPKKMDELKRFAQACRKIQEDFTLSVREGSEETLSRGSNLAFKELVITLKDQIEIMKAWKASGFKEPLEQVVLREFFHKAEISGRAAKDRENMARVFIANKFFQATDPDEFNIQGLSAKTIKQWQGKE